VHDVRQDRVLRLLAQPSCAAARREAGHPIIRSAEPGEDWLWCFVDEVALTFA